MVPESSVQGSTGRRLVANTHEISRPLTGNNTNDNACANRKTTFPMVFLQPSSILATKTGA